MMYSSIYMIETGRNITRLRTKAGMSVKDVQNVFGFATPHAIYKWESGKSMPTIDNLLVLANLFNTSIENIISYKIYLT